MCVFLNCQQDLPKSSSEHLFAASWRTRESTLLRLRKSLLSSLVTKSGDVKLLSTQPCEQVVSACCGVAAFSCSDPVLKVYLASLVSEVFMLCMERACNVWSMHAMYGACMQCMELACNVWSVHAMYVACMQCMELACNVHVSACNVCSLHAMYAACYAEHRGAHE